MAEVSAIERNPLLGGGADWLAKIKQVADAMAASPTPNAAPIGALINMLMGEKAKALDDASYGFPPTTGSGFATQVKPEYASDVADVVPWNKAALGAKAVAAKLAEAGPLGAMVGMLRPKGDPSLILSHGTSSLEAAHGGTLKELLHPSLAVTGGSKLNNPFGVGNYNSLLIPKHGAFDPAYTTSSLFNRDAYVARRSDYPGGTYPTAKQRVEAAGMMPPAHTEGVEYKDWLDERRVTSPHQTAIEASPVFRSLAEFEHSPKGGKLLGVDNGEVLDWSDKFSNDFKTWWADEGSTNSLPLNWIKTLREHAAGGDPRAVELLKSAQRAPSEYAELKVSGAVPITGNRWAGAILSPVNFAQHADTLMARGIPSVEKEAYMDPRRLFEVADAMQRMAGPVKERSLRVRAGWEPGQDVPPRQVYVEPSSSHAMHGDAVDSGLKDDINPEIKAFLAEDMKPFPADAETWHPLNPSALATAKIVFKDMKAATPDVPPVKQFQDAFGDWFSLDNAGNIFAINQSGLNKLVGTVHK